MIKPHGSDTLNPLYVADDTERAALIKEAENLPAILISSGAAASAVMLGSGYFNPLTGYMNLAEATSVAQDMTLPNGLLWPVPVMNIVKAEQVTDVIKNADRIALLDPNVDSQSPIAVMEVAGIEEISDDQRTYLIEQIFGRRTRHTPVWKRLLIWGIRSFLVQSRSSTIPISGLTSLTPSVLLPKSEKILRSEDGIRLSPSRHGIRCTAHMRSYAKSHKTKLMRTES